VCSQCTPAASSSLAWPLVPCVFARGALVYTNTLAASFLACLGTPNFCFLISSAASSWRSCVCVCAGGRVCVIPPQLWDAPHIRSTQVIPTRYLEDAYSVSL
jgi:hypothetical protein